MEELYSIVKDSPLDNIPYVSIETVLVETLKQVIYS